MSVKRVTPAPLSNLHVSDASVCSPPPSQYVLAVGSSVFCAMFYGDLAEEESEIHIPDVEPAAFLILLK